MYNCFCIIGDVRTNEQPGLVSMHTLFLREHNRIWEELRKINPHWTAEELFQTARKIVIGIMQNIVYTEWLPVVMGKDGITQYGLKTDRHVCLSFHFVCFVLFAAYGKCPKISNSSFYTSWPKFGFYAVVS